MSQVKQKYFIEISEKLYSKIKKKYIGILFFSKKKILKTHKKTRSHLIIKLSFCFTFIVRWKRARNSKKRCTRQLCPQFGYYKNPPYKANILSKEKWPYFGDGLISQKYLYSKNKSCPW